MGKLTMVVALATIFSLAVAVPALAVGPVFELGPGDNVYHEKRCPPNGDEEVFGRRGDDRLRLDECGDPNTATSPEDELPDTPDTDSDDDTGNGNTGQDVVRVDDGDIQDTAIGGGGQHDRCVGDLDVGASATSVDDPPTGPGGGIGSEEDMGDTLDASCETIQWVVGFDFFTQASGGDHPVP
jgi:hypothetical protein